MTPRRRLERPGGMRVHVVVVLGLLVAGCSTELEPSAPVPSPALSVARESEAPDRSVTCGGLPFPESRLHDAGGAERNPDPPAAVLRQHVLADPVDPDFLPERGWIEAARTETHVLYIARDPTARDGWVDLVVVLQDGAWTLGGWGTCGLHANVGPDLGSAEFRVAPGEVLDAQSTDIAVLVTERACNSGDDARGRIVVYGVEFGTTSVTVTLAVRPRAGEHTCPSNPETPFVLELPEPLGDRTLLDGSSVPPRDATTCPDFCP